jgi:hypothetical protein
VQVGHDVIVLPGGNLWDKDGQVGHDITAINPAGVVIGGNGTPTGGMVGHDISILGVSGSGPRNANWLCNTHVGHDVSILFSASTAAPWDIGDYQPECGGGGITVGHDLNVFGNSLAPVVESNSVGHDANCQANHTSSISAVITSASIASRIVISAATSWPDSSAAANAPAGCEIRRS